MNKSTVKGSNYPSVLKLIGIINFERSLFYSFDTLLTLSKKKDKTKGKRKKRLYKDNTIYINRLFPFQFSRNTFRLLPCQPCSLKILINIFRYKSNFCKPERENWPWGIRNVFIKKCRSNAIYHISITYSAFKRYSSGTPSIMISSHISQTLWFKSKLIRWTDELATLSVFVEILLSIFE